MTLNQPSRSGGINGNGLRTWGFLFVLLGITGQCILQNRLLGLNSLDPQDILAVLDAAPANMGIATAALVCKAFQTCAAPLFTFLLVEGFLHTSSVKNYLLRVIGVAVLSEIPYNLAMSEKWFDLSGRNPVFGMALCLILLILYSRYQEKGFRNLMIKAAFTVAAIVWMKMLSIEDGACLVVLTATFWGFRGKPHFRNMAGLGAAGFCAAFSLFYLASPMSVMALHFYNGEPGNRNRLFNYLSYPLILLCFGLAVKFF